MDRSDSREHPPILLVEDKPTDIDLTLRAFKRHKDPQRLPVVVLTRSSEHRDVKTAYQPGADSHTVKPVDFDKFIQVAPQLELYWCVINRRAQ